MKRLILIFLDIPITETFTPLESPSMPVCRQVCWGWWKYLQKQEHQLLMEGGVRPLLSNGVDLTDKAF